MQWAKRCQKINGKTPEDGRELITQVTSVHHNLIQDPTSLVKTRTHLKQFLLFRYLILPKYAQVPSMEFQRTNTRKAWLRTKYKDSSEPDILVLVLNAWIKLDNP